MAQQIINNLETGLVVRDKINDNFTEAYNGIFLQGNQTATQGVIARVDKVIEDNAVEPVAGRGGYWPGSPVYIYGAVSKAFDNTQVVGITNGGPFAAFFVNTTNNGSNADVCAQINVANARQSDRTVFGLNVLATNTVGTTNTKLVGMEIDLQPSPGTTISSNSIGLAINAFSIACPAPAILLGGVSGGTFNNGIVIGGVASTGAGVSGESTATMGSLINTGAATYTQAAVILSNQHALRLSGTSTTHARIYNDGANNVRCVLGSGSWIFRDSTDVTSLISVDGGGNFNLEAGGAFRISSTQVVGPRGAAVPDATGGATVDTEARAAINTLLARLRTHGLIAT